MKICIITGNYPVLSETFIEKQIIGLGATVYTLKTQSGLRHEGQNQPQVIVSPTRSLKDRIETRAFKIANKLKRYDSGSYILSSSQHHHLSDTLTTMACDVVLIQYGTTGISVWEAVAATGIPFAVHFHGFDLSQMYRNAHYREALAAMAEKAGALIVVNSIMKERLEKIGVPASKIEVITYGVDVGKFAQQPSERTVGGPFNLIAVGRFTPKKAPLVTIAAFAEAYARRGNIRLKMIGEGELYADALKLVKELKLEEVVSLPGAVPHREIFGELSRAHAFIQHSVTSPVGDEEGWPNAIAEALAVGRPVLSTRHAGIMDQVVEGENGLLVDENDASGQADAIVEMAELSPEEYRRWCDNAREHMVNNGNFSNQLSLLRQLLAQVAEK